MVLFLGADLWESNFKITLTKSNPGLERATVGGGFSPHNASSCLRSFPDHFTIAVIVFVETEFL